MRLLKTIEGKDFPDDLYSTREAVRAIAQDKNGLLPLLFVGKYNYHKLPGGGVEEGEDFSSALHREMMEETGCTIEIGKEIGMIHEQRSAKQFEYDLLQTSYCYEAKILEKGTAPEFTQEEKDEGFELLWTDLGGAIDLLSSDMPTNVEGKYIQERDLTFLKSVQGK